MPSLPLPEPNDEEQSNAEVIRGIARSALNAAGAEKIGARAYVTLFVLVLAAITNPVLPLAIAGGFAGVILSLDIARVRK
jgi:hypothetical protein